MSDWITLTARVIDAPISLGALDPARLGELTEHDIAALPVLQGRHRASIGDFFTVRGAHASRVRIEGSTNALESIGRGMTGGELEIQGDAGSYVADGMSGGSLRVTGNVGDDAGLAMSGGVLRITGNAGNRLGAAHPGAAKGMTGGEIVLDGSAGEETGARMRRGLIVVSGHASRDAGRGMIAGSLIVLGSCGDSPGRGSKRGTIVVCDGVTVPPTYRYACTYQPPHVRLTLLYLVRRHGLAVDPSIIEGLFRRYCGDAGNPGKGEILERVRGV